MICEKCKNEHDGTFGSGRFCSRSCANSRDRPLELRNKVSLTLRQKSQWFNVSKKFCSDCKKLLSRKNTSGFCASCNSKHKNRTPEARKKQSEVAKAAVANGTHKGWTTRKIASYPEKFFIEVLHNNGLEKDVDYKFNFCVSKTSLGIKSCANYFLDFYFEDLRLDLEIDGKQHQYKDRAESDEERDKLLKENGFVIYRIKWKSINNDAGKAYIKNEIEKFFDYFRFHSSR